MGFFASVLVCSACMGHAFGVNPPARTLVEQESRKLDAEDALSALLFAVNPANTAGRSSIARVSAQQPVTRASILMQEADEDAELEMLKNVLESWEGKEGESPELISDVQALSSKLAVLAKDADAAGQRKAIEEFVAKWNGSEGPGQGTMSIEGEEVAIPSYGDTYAQIFASLLDVSEEVKDLPSFTEMMKAR